MYKNKPKAPQQWTAIERDAVPLAVMIAPEEYAKGCVIVKAQKGKDSSEGQGKGDTVPIDSVVQYVREKLAEA